MVTSVSLSTRGLLQRGDAKTSQKMNSAILLLFIMKFLTPSSLSLTKESQSKLSCSASPLCHMIYIYCHNPDLFVFPPLSHHSFCSFQTSCSLLALGAHHAADVSYQVFISTALTHFQKYSVRFTSVLFVGM